MANTFLLKRGQKVNIADVILKEGEPAVAFNEDKSKVELYIGTGADNGKGKLLVNADVTADIADILTQAQNYTNTKISELVNGAPEAMDTLKELADAIGSNGDIMTAINKKVDKVEGKGLSTEDYTTAEKEKLAGLNNYTHPTSHAATMITEDDTHRFATDTEKAEWNAKLGADSVIDGGTF